MNISEPSTSDVWMLNAVILVFLRLEFHMETVFLYVSSPYLQSGSTHRAAAIDKVYCRPVDSSLFWGLLRSSK